MNPEYQLGAFIVIFGLLATVKSCRVTASIILGASLLNLIMLNWYNEMSDMGAIAHLIILAGFDFAAGFAILCLGDAKRGVQVCLHGLFVLSHAIIGIELTIGANFIYNIYEELIIGLNIIQIVVMWGCYAELYGNTSRLFTHPIIPRLFNFNRFRVLVGNSGHESHKENSEKVA